MKENKTVFKEFIQVSRSDIDFIEDLLERSNNISSSDGMDLEREGVDRNSLIRSYTAKFKDGCEADIKLVSTDDDLYIDAILFDEQGHELIVFDPCYEFLGDFEFELEKDGQVIIYKLVLVEALEEIEKHPGLNGRTVLMKTHAGSYNYNLLTAISDLDYKIYIAPSFDDLYLGNSFVSNVEISGADCDFQDIRRLSNLLRKSNINFIEGLFSREIILTENQEIRTLLLELIGMREEIASINLSYLYDSCMGMSFNKEKLALKRVYEEMSKKDLMTSYRVLDFLQRYYRTGFKDFERAIRYTNDERDNILRFRSQDIDDSLLELKRKRSDVEALRNEYKKALNEETDRKMNHILKEIIFTLIKR